MAVHIRNMDNPPTTAVQLHVGVQQAWVALRYVNLSTLVWSMPRRMFATLAVRGGHTHYQPIIYDAINPFYRVTKFQKISTAALFATDIVNWYMLEWHPPDRTA